MRLHSIKSLCVQVLFLFFLAPNPFPAAQNLVSNIDGKIRTVIVNFGDGGLDGFWHDQTIFIGELAAKMDRDVDFLVLLGNDARADRVRQALAPWASDRLADGKPRIRFLVVDVPTWQFYPYARDHFLILAEKKGGLIFLDAGFNEPPFPIVNLADAFPGAQVQAGVIHRGGGNIRSSNEDIIVGMDTILGISLPGRWGNDSGQLYFQAKTLDAGVIQAAKIADRLDRTAEEMSGLGYCVVRVPYLPNGLAENTAEDEAFGIGFNYSNVLVEVFPGTKRVYIPEYGLAELDKAAAAVYKENGYAVVAIRGLVADSVTNQLDGAGLDCLTNEIRWPEAH